MEEWNAMMAGRTFITDLGAPRQTQSEGKQVTLGQYAVWSPLRGGDGHTIIEVGDDLEELMERYRVPAERVCTLAAP